MDLNLKTSYSSLITGGLWRLIYAYIYYHRESIIYLKNAQRYIL